MANTRKAIVGHVSTKLPLKGLLRLTSIISGEIYTFPSAHEIFPAVPAGRARKSYSRVIKPAIESLPRIMSRDL